MGEQYWMAVYTKPRNEKKVAERLSEKGFQVYCPLITTLRQWSDRKKKVKIPIFPSYVFIFLTEKERVEVLKDPGVLNFVFYLGKPALIKEDEILTIKRLFDNLDDNSEVYIQKYNKGDKVDIVAGPFRELKGIVEEIKKSEITLLVDSLGMTVKIKTNTNYIK